LFHKGVIELVLAQFLRKVKNEKNLQKKPKVR